MGNLFEKTLNSKEIYNGKIFKVRCDNVELPNGSFVSRDVVDHVDGVAIAAEIDDKIIMVKQFRYPTQDVLYELPAGKLDEDDEDVLSCAKRELEEETGYCANHWESLGYIWTSPGFCTERLYLFKASDLYFKGQHLDEDEFLDCIKVDKDKLIDMIRLGIINDAKSIAGIMRAC